MEVTGGAGSVCVERFEDYPQMGRFTLRDQVCVFLKVIPVLLRHPLTRYKGTNHCYRKNYQASAR